MQPIPFEDIEARLRQIFPSLEVFAPTDREYVTADRSDIRRLIPIYPPPPWFMHINECEEIARRFMVQVRDWELATIGSRPVELRCNMAFGVAHGSRFQGVDKDHTINVFLTDDAVLLLDMQTGKFWPAVEGQDEIFYVEM